MGKMEGAKLAVLHETKSDEHETKSDEHEMKSEYARNRVGIFPFFADGEEASILACGKVCGKLVGLLNLHKNLKKMWKTSGFLLFSIGFSTFFA